MKKEYLEQFAAAPWRSAEEINSFIGQIGEVTTSDILALLEILTGKKVVTGTPEQERRTQVFAALAREVGDRTLFEPYLRAVKLDDRHLRSVLIELIPPVAALPLRPKVCELLKSPDAALRKTAVQILLKLRDPNVLRTIGEYFQDRTFQGRTDAIDLAGSLSGHHSAELFKMVLTTGKSLEKVRTLKFLASPTYLSGNHRLIVAIVLPALTDTDESVVAEGITTFAAVCTEEEYFSNVGDYFHADSIRLVRTAVEGLRRFPSERAIAVLEKKLRIGPNPIRMAVLDTVEAIGTVSICKVLIKALEHKNNVVRERASEVLSNLGRDGKIDRALSFLWLLRSEDPNVKQFASKLATSLHDDRQRLWSEVLAFLINEEWRVRQRTVGTLVEIAKQELRPLIQTYLQDPRALIRRFALDVLCRLKSPQSLSGVQQIALHDEDWWVREKAIEVLAELGGEQVLPTLLAIGENAPTFRVCVIAALKKMGARSTAPQIATYLTTPNLDVRLAALDCLDAFADPSFGPVIIPLLKDANFKVRNRARALATAWNITDGAGDASIIVPLSAIDKLLIGLHKGGGDDLILLPENPAYMRKLGKNVTLTTNKVTSQQMQAILTPLLSAKQQAELANQRDVDFSYEVKSEGLRFRANIFNSRTGLSAVFRIIKGNVWNLEDLGLPPVVNTFGDLKNGLVLVGGPTGSGKSTTLSTIVAYINRTYRRHIISIEDPIETIHRSDKGLINQREVGVHTPSFTHALRLTLREDPDVILVGELRDLPTIQFAVTAAETGHLVFGTVHTVSADATVDRLINAYPPESQEQVRSMLADSLRAVLCQYLIRNREDDRMVLASEIMLNNNAIANLIRKGKTFQIPSVIATSREQQMQLMDTSLIELCKRGKISVEEGYLKARNKSEFEEMLGVAGTASSSGRPNPGTKK